jgi:hypothetical protein
MRAEKGLGAHSTQHILKVSTVMQISQTGGNGVQTPLRRDLSWMPDAPWVYSMFGHFVFSPSLSTGGARQALKGALTCQTHTPLAPTTLVVFRSSK